MISHSCTCRATEDGTPNLRSPRRKRSEAQAICAQDDFDFQQNPIMIFFLLESEESLKQILFQFPSSTAPIFLYCTVLLAELHMQTPSADKDSCNGGQEDRRQDAFYKTIYFVISLALFWRLQILFFTFLNADILSGRKESYQVLRRPFLLRSISMKPLNSRKNCYAINI